MNYKFTKHNYVRAKDGKVVLLLELSHEGQRHKEPIKDLYVDPKKWNEKKQRVNPKTDDDYITNEILDQIEKKILSIKTRYARDLKVLTISRFIEEYTYFNSFYDFIAFMDREITEDSKGLKPGTARYLKSVKTKLETWRKEIPFYTIDDSFFNDYRKFCTDKGNVQHTIARNIKVIKKYLRKARKKGIHFEIDLEEIKVGSFDSNRVDLTVLEVRKLLKTFYGTTLTNTQHHALGLFLFSCFTGLRYQDLHDFKLSNISEDVIIIRMSKVNEPLRLPLTEGAKRIALSIDWNRKYCYQVNLKFLKEAAEKAGIRKRVSFHVARHTFASNYIRTDGNVADLQKLLGHRKIQTTMIYVHNNQTEQNKHIHKLDSVYSYNNDENKQV